MHIYRLAVFGHPIAQSRSPEIHQLFAKQAGLSIDYVKIDPGLNGFIAGCEAFKAKGGAGFNVTMPFKQQAYQYVDELSPRVLPAGAVNTVKIMENGRMLGDNTDGDGLVNALHQDLGYELQGKTVLILGAGGAVQGILPALLAQKPRTIYIMNRTLAKAEHLARVMAATDIYPPSPNPGEKSFAPTQKTSVTAPTLTSNAAAPTLTSNAAAPTLTSNAAAPTTKSNVSGVIPLALDAKLTEPVDLLINAVAFNHLVLPQTLTFAPHALAYDLSYGAVTKPFTEWATAQGSTHVSDGFSMLVCQAALSFKLWTGFAPDVAPVLAAMR